MCNHHVQRILGSFKADATGASDTALRGATDTDEDQVRALAIVAKAEIIVSGDDNLLSLTSFEGIAIVAPAVALQRISTP